MYRVLILGGSGFLGKAIITEMNKDEELDRECLRFCVNGNNYY